MTNHNTEWHTIRDETWYEFVWMPLFEKTSKGFLGERDRREIERVLCENVKKGPVIRETGGFRKLRHALREGKRGGARVIYFPDRPCGRIYMLLAYRKSSQDSLTRSEKVELSKLAQALKSEGC